VNQAMQSVHGGLVEIMLTVPLNSLERYDSFGVRTTPFYLQWPVQKLYNLLCRSGTLNEAEFTVQKLD